MTYVPARPVVWADITDAPDMSNEAMAAKIDARLAVKLPDIEARLDAKLKPAPIEIIKEA